MPRTFGVTIINARTGFQECSFDDVNVSYDKEHRSVSIIEEDGTVKFFTNVSLIDFNGTFLVLSGFEPLISGSGIVPSEWIIRIAF